VGLYQAASQISIIAPLVLTGFNQIFTPMMADLFHGGESERLSELYRVSTKWAVLMLLPVAATAMLVPGSLLVALFGPGFEHAAWSLRILMTGQLVNAATGAVGILLMMSGNHRIWMWLGTAALGLNLVLNTLLVPRYGIIGAAWATSISLVFLFPAAMWMVGRKLRLSPYDRRGLKLVLAAFVSALAVVAVRSLALASPVATVVASFLAAGLATVVVWALLGIDREDGQMLELLWSRAVSRRSTVSR
jgi:O-antigen/teichoic acid export membrane protein